MSQYDDYVTDLNLQLWDYAEREFESRSDLLDSTVRTGRRPPVFRPSAANHNILLPPGVTAEVQVGIEQSIPVKERHRHFASMRSSQALAQSVFGCLWVLR